MHDVFEEWIDGQIKFLSAVCESLGSDSETRSSYCIALEKLKDCKRVYTKLKFKE